MYLDHFGFKQKPFSITPDPRFVFLSEPHREAYAHLLYGIRNRSGFIELSGEIGAGKTTLLRTLLGELAEDHYRTAFIFNPRLSALDLLRSINLEFAIDCDGSRSDLFNALNQFLLQENAAGRTVVMVVDEAQNLKTTALEEIRLLSNLETETDKLIQIVLVGQPELQELLTRPELEQLNQRISVRYHLRAIDFQDTCLYVAHRLEIGGLGEPSPFTAGALKQIFRCTGGVPRRINVLCDRCLLLAYTEDQAIVSRGLVRRAVSELRHDRSWLGRLPRLASSFGMLLAVLALGAFGYRQFLAADSLPSGAGSQASARKSQSAQELGTVDRLRSELGHLTEAASRRIAAGTIEIGWGAAAERGEVGYARFQCRLNDLVRINTPALLKVSLPGVAGSRFLALTSTRGGRFELRSSRDDRIVLDRWQMDQIWRGEALIPWVNFDGIPLIATQGASGEAVRSLQSLLAKCDLYEGALSGLYDDRTVAIVTRFQQQWGIPVDGQVGPQTLLLLYRVSGLYPQPQLLATDGGAQ